MALLDPPLGVVVGKVVSLSVAELGRTPVVGVTQVHRYLTGTRRLSITFGGPQGGSHPVRLGGRGQVDHGLGEVQLGLG